MRILAKGWQLAALGGNSVALEWGDPAAGLWVRRLLGCHPCAAACVPVSVYRLHTDPVARGLTVFGGVDCLYRGSDPAGGAHAVMEAMMHVWTRSCRDGLMLHAALMSKRGRGLMIGGVSGAGKSSLAAWFIRQGWTYHGDEQMYADASDRHWEGFVRPLCFKGDWASMFPAVAARPESVAMVAGQNLVPANVFGQEILPEALSSAWNHVVSHIPEGIGFFTQAPSRGAGGDPADAVRAQRWKFDPSRRGTGRRDCARLSRIRNDLWAF